MSCTARANLYSACVPSDLRLDAMCALSFSDQTGQIQSGSPTVSNTTNRTSANLYTHTLVIIRHPSQHNIALLAVSDCFVRRLAAWLASVPLLQLQGFMSISHRV